MPTEPVSRFVEDYRRVRLEEGFASTDPAFARRLPFHDTTGRNAAAWRVRALHYLVIRAGLTLVPGVRRVLDVGAGNGWLARRLAGSFAVTALDVDGGDTGLRAIDDRRIARVRGDLQTLPVRAGSFDAVVAAAALHYAVDQAAALGEMARVLRRRGVIVIADSPVYADAAARDAAWRRTGDYYAGLGAAHLAQRYRGLVRAELADTGLFRWVTVAPGLPSIAAALARLRGRDPGARLPVLFGLKRG
jgi:SAM-dependent methyltransferase